MNSRPSAWRSVAQAMKSWRTASVSLLGFSSGLPLGLVWIAIPDWMASIGVDIRIVGLFTLAQAPWVFKILWSPFMDRYVPPFWGRRRGWVAIAQIALSALLLVLAGVGHHPDTPWVVAALAFAIAFASASQDIAYDAYAVEVLHKDEQGVAVGARTAFYRAAMFIAGGLSITLASLYSWPLVNVILAVSFLPMILLTWKAPEPEVKQKPPATLKQAVWLPFLEALSRHRALEILAFVILYKFSDNLAGALLRPFLGDMGYSGIDRGVALGTVGNIASLSGTFIGGVLTTIMGLGPALWVFGFFQIFSNVGYILIADSGINRPLMYGAMGFESFTQGLATGAFMVLLLRMTRKRFSATQYALFSSLFAIPRLLGGPIAGFVVHAVGWKLFFWSTMIAGIPGLVLLYRFCPFGVREPSFEVETAEPGPPISNLNLFGRGVVGAIVGTGFVALCSATLKSLRNFVGDKGSFDFLPSLAGLFQPAGIIESIELAGIIVIGLICGLGVAAVSAARHGAGRALVTGETDGV